MSKIFWLASYPKSGNTWMRVFLHNLLWNDDGAFDINDMHKAQSAARRDIFDETVGVDSADLSHDEAEWLKPEVYEHFAAQSDEPIFLKIHDAFTYTDSEKQRPLIPPRATAKVAYILRNPLDVAVSSANHSAITIEKAVENMANEAYCLGKSTTSHGKQLRQRLLSWSSHVQSWVRAPGMDIHVVRYEDLKHSPLETFSALVRFLGYEHSEAKIKRAIEASAFSRLQQQEKEKVFAEKPQRCPAFFHQGKTGYWRDFLSGAQAEAMIKKHGHVMRQFGYLNKHGNPVF
jgi:hypothetical protein